MTLSQLIEIYDNNPSDINPDRIYNVSLIEGKDPSLWVKGSIVETLSKNQKQYLATLLWGSRTTDQE